jgi:DNA primase
MNVRICTFPEGEDPDSFAKNNSLEDLKQYLEDNAHDFIAFKASLLASEAKNDPIKKAETIRDMITSISKIPDAIKQEVYIKECARIMDISEEVLFSTLAQMLQKDQRDANRKSKQEAPQPMEVVAAEKKVVKKVDIQFELERKIIELLLLYGNEEEDFEDLILEATEDGEIAFKPEKVTSRVFEKVYLDLQDDEIEFTNDSFKALYFEIINHLNLLQQDFKVELFINKLEPEAAEAVTHILMDEEKYQLHAWDTKEIFVKEKKSTIGQVVSETILNLRRHLVAMKIEALANEVHTIAADERMSLLENVRDYNSLRMVLSEKLRRVI